jgi:hypothetical protein
MGQGHVSFRVMNVSWIDLDPLAFILRILNQFWIAIRLGCSLCEHGSLSMVTTAVSLAGVTVVDPGEVGRSAVYSGIIMAIEHCLVAHLYSVRTVLCTQFQPVRGSVCYANLLRCH